MAMTDLSKGPQLDLHELINFSVLRSWMTEQGVTEGPLEVLGLLGGGTQNILVHLRVGNQNLVLRRGPQHLRPRTNDQLRQEMRVLQALRRTEVPHAQIVAACPDEDVLGGAAFYLMEMVDGFNPGVGLSETVASSAAAQRELCLSAVRSIATLGTVDYEAAGLGEVGKPAKFLERQVGRWRAELESYSTLDGYDGSSLPGTVHQAGDWLEQNRPDQWRPGIMHGDSHLANLLCDRQTGRVLALIDWEMATIGDPLLDLGWLLATWPQGAEIEVLPDGTRELVGVITQDELIRHYAENSIRDLTHINWYIVLACYKLAIILEGTHARACAGLAPREVADRLHVSSLVLLERAQQIIDGGVSGR